MDICWLLILQNSVPEPWFQYNPQWSEHRHFLIENCLSCEGLGVQDWGNFVNLEYHKELQWSSTDVLLYKGCLHHESAIKQWWYLFDFKWIQWISFSFHFFFISWSSHAGDWCKSEEILEVYMHGGSCPRDSHNRWWKLPRGIQIPRRRMLKECGDGDLPDAVASFHVICNLPGIHDILYVSSCILFPSSITANEFKYVGIHCKRWLNAGSFLCPLWFTLNPICSFPLCL